MANIVLRVENFDGLNRSGILLKLLGKARAAEKVWLRLRESAHHQQRWEWVALADTNLGKLYLSQGRYDDAEAKLKAALLTREKTSGPNHADVALILNCMAELYTRQRRVGEAERSLVRALAIQGVTVAS